MPETSRFGNTKTARQSGAGAFFKEGTFIVEVKMLKYEASRNPKRPKGTENLIGEFLIVESSREDIKPGMVRTQVISRVPSDPEAVKTQLAEGDIQNLSIAVLLGMGLTKKQIDAMTSEEFGQAVEELVGAANPAAQKKVRLQLTATEIKLSNGSPFTKHSWEAAPAQKATAA